MKKKLPFIMAMILLGAVITCTLLFSAGGSAGGSSLEGARFIYADER